MPPTSRTAGFAQRIHRLARDAFDRDSLEPIVYFSLDERLDVVAPEEKSFGATVFRVVMWAEQLGRLLDLGRAIANERQGRPDADQLLRDIEAASAGDQFLRSAPHPGDSKVLQSAVERLTRWYDRRKGLMSPGDQIEEVMGEILAMLNDLPLDKLDLPKLYHLSVSDGERLAAIVSLQKYPDVQYLQWLSERLAVESTFLGCQAMVALRAAAQGLSVTELDRIEGAVQRAERWLQADEIEPRRLLEEARSFLSSRTTRP